MNPKLGNYAKLCEIVCVISWWMLDRGLFSTRRDMSSWGHCTEAVKRNADIIFQRDENKEKRLRSEAMVKRKSFSSWKELPQVTATYTHRHKKSLFLLTVQKTLFISFWPCPCFLFSYRRAADTHNIFLSSPHVPIPVLLSLLIFILFLIEN